ncbi:isochorismatase family cysteine hydrolase [Nitrosopumilus sp.]|uniref:isochorismatase family cysteine hydrolase n=1 Tax=Nitrosopumilus sp. TaxID=2024843 RepID=UPI00247E0C15|nr:isochorismatase family cysteine hydrolase [Nitrosopumilus sp.]MCV0409296.1 cysteine hydrolase [Nitrosopumilus sp.]
MNDVLTVPEWHEEVNLHSKITLVVVDMQKLFLTDKKSPWMDKKLLSIIPNIKKLIEILGEQNVIFTRFMPPKNWQDEHGSWQAYYKMNQKVTTRILGTGALDIIDDFLPYVANASVASRKKSASAFMAGNFHSKIKKQSVQILIFTGIETDYCVLSSVLDAIHLGYFVIVVMDACASSKKQGQKHAQGIFERFPEQLWITSTDDLIKHFQNHIKN